MNATIKFWLEYAGGMDIIWLVLSVLAITQLFKMLLKAFGKLRADTVRPFPYMAGSFLGLMFVDFSARGALIGVACGMVSSVGYYAASAYFERDGATNWQKMIADRLNLK